MEKIILAVIVAGGLMVSGCGKQQEQATSTQSASLEKQAQGLSEDAKEAAEQGKKDAAKAANNVVNQVKELLAKAKTMIDNGKFDEAINLAQQALNIDPNNIDAKNIIETAKAKLAQMAQQKAGELKSGLTNKLNALGN